jgi:soluble lytic murein transglycosylase-like protein
MRDKFRQAMETSLQKQRASVRTQASGIEAARRSAASQVLRPSLEKQRASVEQQLSIARPPTVAFQFPATPPVYAAWQPPLDPGCRRIPTSTLDPHIERVARDEGLLPELLRVVIGRESGFQPCAVSSKGALGLMQLMPATAYDLGVENPFDPEENISGGARYLKQLLTRFQGNLPLALAAYNAGPATVDTHGAVPPIQETQDYVADIVRRLQWTGN